MSDYIITCDDEVASWVGNDVETMKEIVRCRDCKRFHTNTNGFDCLKLEPNGFCAWGERK